MESYKKIENQKIISFDKVVTQCEENIAFYSNHLELLRGYISRIDEVTSIIKESNKNANLDGFIDMRNFINYNGYVTISSLDLSVNLKHLSEANTNWERIFFIKNSFLIIHETINKLKPTIGKSIIELTIYQKYPILRLTLKQLFDQIENFKVSVNYSKIENARHFAAGHIEKSLKKYYNSVSVLDAEETTKYISQFIPIINLAAELIAGIAKLAHLKKIEKSKEIYPEFLKLKGIIESLKVT